MPLSPRAALLLAAPWAGWAAVRATGAERGSPLVPAMAFTRYAAVTSVLPVAAAVLARARGAALLAGGAAAVLGGSVLAGPVLGGLHRRPGAPLDGPALRVVSLNLLHGRADPDAVVAIVRGADADVLALSEVTPDAVTALQRAGVADLLPHEHVVPAYRGERPGAGGALWTRLEVRTRSAVPGRFSQPAAVLALPGGPDVEVTAVHNHPPIAQRFVARWQADLALLPAPEDGLLRVLAGDFNATPDLVAFRRLLRRGWVDAARVTGSALEHTWTPEGRRQPRLTLDHVLVDPRIGVAAFEVVRVPGTDHRAVVADLRLPREL